jgi:hypothetical protein
MLGRSRAERYDPVPVEGWLCQAFQVERQQDWPVAPLTLAIDGGDTGDAYWLRADPVHFRIERNRVLFIENALFDVNADEAQALVSSINEHFGGEGIVFHAPAPKRWYAKLQRTPNLVTRCASEAAGGDVQLFLPSGSDALYWHRLANEVQMLLHAHGVNSDREARGEPLVNSIWFWGGGVRTSVRGRPYDAIWSTDAVAVALAAGADLPATGSPADAESWLKDAQSAADDASSHLIVLDELAAASAHGDSGEWRDRLSALETRWFAPLVRALREGRIASLALIAPGPASCWRFDLTRTDLLKLWRRAKPLPTYA